MLLECESYRAAFGHLVDVLAPLVLEADLFEVVAFEERLLDLGLVRGLVLEFDAVVDFDNEEVVELLGRGSAIADDFGLVRC